MKTKVESFKHMRKSNCKLCDGWGYITVLKGERELTKACFCSAGKDKTEIDHYKMGDKLKYPLDMVLTEKETEIYNKIKVTKKIELCPF